MLIAAAAIGAAIATVAIYLEESGRWHTRDSIRFFAVAVPVVFVPWIGFLWSRIKLVPRNDV